MIPATEPMLSIKLGEAVIKRGTKAWFKATMAKKFVSKVCRTSSRGASRAGRVRFRPLLEEGVSRYRNKNTREK